MKAFETTIKPLVKFGEGSSLCAGEKIKLLGCTKVLAGYDANINPAVVDAVIGSIEKEGIEVVRYACSYSDGKDDGVIECRQLALDNKVDGFLAMGGGSTMDIVKAASLLVNVDLPEGAKSLVNYFVGHYNGPDLPRHAGLISIPTTAGTGAEATRSCIIASRALGVKATLSSQAAKADWVLLDPEMTKDLPPTSRRSPAWTPSPTPARPSAAPAATSTPRRSAASPSSSRGRTCPSSTRSPTTWRRAPT